MLVLNTQIQKDIAQGKFAHAAKTAVEWLADSTNEPLKPGSAAADALVLAFDQIHQCQDLPADVSKDLNSILNALEELGRGAFASALTHIKPVGLRSLFSSWKWFIKGVCAYYHHDNAKANLAFTKLSAGSVPQKAAEPFQVLMEPSITTSTNLPASQVVPSLFLLAHQENIAGPVTHADALWQQQCYQESFKHIKANLPEFPTQKTGIACSLTDFYFGAFNQMVPAVAENYLNYLQDESQKGTTENNLERFKATQAMALWLEKEFEWEGDIVDTWKKALGHFTALNDDRAATTLIYLRLGRLFAEEEPQEDDQNLLGYRRRKRRIVLRNAELAESCYLKALDANPDSHDVYLALLELYEKLGDKSKINRTLDKIIKRFPDEKYTLFKAGLRCVERDALIKGIKYLGQAILLDPIDWRLRNSYQLACIKAAVNYAQKERKDKCIQVLEKAEQHAIFGADDFNIGLAYLYARWAAILGLFEDNSHVEADQMVSKALSVASDPLKLHYFTWLMGRSYAIPKVALAQSRSVIEHNLAAPFDPKVGATFVNVISYCLYLSSGNGQWLDSEINAINDYLDKAAAPDCTVFQARIFVEYALDDKINQINIAQKYTTLILDKTPENARFRWFNFLCNFSMDTHPSRLGNSISELQEIIGLAEHQGNLDVFQTARKVLSHIQGTIKAFEEFNECYGEWEDDQLDAEDELNKDDESEACASNTDKPLDDLLVGEDEPEVLREQRQMDLFDFIDFDSSDD